MNGCKYYTERPKKIFGSLNRPKKGKTLWKVLEKQNCAK